MEKHGPGYSRAAMGAMRYADALAREVLRIWGPADVLFRRARHLLSPEEKSFLHAARAFQKRMKDMLSSIWSNVPNALGHHWGGMTYLSDMDTETLLTCEACCAAMA